MEYVEIRHYEAVSSSSTSTNDYTVPNNKMLTLESIGGNGALLPTVKVEIWLDTELILATHGRANQNTKKSLQGNGSKKVQIKLVNDADTTETIGGFWIGGLTDV